MSNRENEYDLGTRVHCRAVFCDPVTSTQLTAFAATGSTVLAVRSGTLGLGFLAGVQIAVGEGENIDLLSVVAPGASATAIPTTATVHPHNTGEPVGLLSDPGPVVTFKVTSPNGTVTTSTGLRDQVGVYHVQVTPLESGTWYYRAESELSAVKRSFYVRPA